LRRDRELHPDSLSNVADGQSDRGSDHVLTDRGSDHVLADRGSDPTTL
jgi:hypothetical protein